MSERINLPHLILSGTSVTERYVSLGAGGKEKIPQRDRLSHGDRLLQRCREIIQQTEGLIRTQADLGGIQGNLIEFESEEDFPLALKSLDLSASGIELLNVRRFGEKTFATVFVPKGKMSLLEKRFIRYINENSRSGEPRHQRLINSIADFRRAALRALWTDADDVFPDECENIWWELWLRVGEENENILELFKREAPKFGLLIREGELHFPDRTVLLAFGNREQLTQSIDFLNCIGEVRRAKETPEIFTNMSPREQAELVRECRERTSPPPEDAPAICILDTGVNREHPLIEAGLSHGDVHTCKTSWGAHDHHGHGTGMAGLALYGDLTEVLCSTEPVVLNHRLESVKLLPPGGNNPPELYGVISSESVNRAVIAAPMRRRAICLAVTTNDRDRGEPSSWSAALDQLCSGAEDGQQHLIFVSAGNTAPRYRHEYPDRNITEGIQEPGQAWNVVTVGAMTEHIFIDQDKYPGWKPLAKKQGDLSPSSTTSVSWESQWPLKPDIVLEGGNQALDPSTGNADSQDSLDLLTTHWKPSEKLLVAFGDTSAATALAARMAAMLQHQYPELWPETIHALMVHSARWTPAMEERREGDSPRRRIENRLRCFGFGAPDLSRALWSLRNSLTLIVQDSLQPYTRENDKMKTLDMHIHTLPWADEVLRDLGETEVEMRVTLSYFIEPNPGKRGYQDRHRYRSHGLRFDVKTPQETYDQFRKRINKAARDEEDEKGTKSDSDEWLVGQKLRNLGSLHSDIWKGTAADLADKKHFAVYPVIGWWRERHTLGKWSKRARYAFLVSLSTPHTEVDLYTPIVNKIATTIPIEIEYQ